MEKNIDLTYVFLLTFQKKISKIKDQIALRSLCEFILNKVVTFIVTQDP